MPPELNPARLQEALPQEPWAWRKALGWAFYDWANMGYALVVLASFYPIFYESYWAKGLSAGEQTFWFGMTVSLASLIVAVLAPFLGSIAWLGGIRKRLLLRFAAVGMIACAGFFFVGEGHYLIASGIYIIGTVCFYCANIFFDALLPDVSTRRNRHVISGMGFTFGYTASTLLLLAYLWVIKNHGLLGIPDLVWAFKFIFLSAAVWWAVFTVPLVCLIDEVPRTDYPGHIRAVKNGALEAWRTLLDIIRIKPVMWFLLAYLFYIDGVNTVITMSINYAKGIGFKDAQLLTALLVVQVFGVPFAVLFGWLGQRFGARKMIFVAIFAYMGVTFYGTFLKLEPVQIGALAISEIYILAAMIGMVQGGVQALSRSFFANLVPAEKSTAFFGFYSMIGKSAAVLGPALMAVVALFTDQPRLGIAAVSILFVIGAVLLACVRPQQPAE